MRITAVEPIIVDIPTRDPVKGVHGVTRAQRSVLVRVATDRDHVGCGNVDPNPGYTLMLAEEIEAAIRGLKQGGLTRTIEMVHTAAAAGFGVVIGHGFGLTLSALAEAAVAPVFPAVFDGCEAVGRSKSRLML